MIRERIAVIGAGISGLTSFGAGCAETLRQWHGCFHDRRDGLAEMGFSERFRRMWEFYLAYSESGFRSGYLDVWQFGFHKPAQD